mmetsp:Transcript_20/g.55  ORF Transcript_20/g.55 Transcript_20/m.55 type:complete len:178 (-) Transcript_20:383-916(-)
MVAFFSGRWAGKNKPYTDELRTSVQRFYPGETEGNRRARYQPLVWKTAASNSVVSRGKLSVSMIVKDIFDTTMDGSGSSDARKDAVACGNGAANKEADQIAGPGLAGIAFGDSGVEVERPSQTEPYKVFAPVDQPDETTLPVKQQGETALPDMVRPLPTKMVSSIPVSTKLSCCLLQ